MATKTKATHRGNCQVCGHQQHVMGTVLAKHGYTVEYGYFNGTCRGSDRQPIQTDRTLTYSTILGLFKFSAACDQSAANLRAGTVHPTRIQTGEKLNPATSRYEAVYISWEAGSDYQKLQAVERAVNGAERDARNARAHADSLKKLAAELHGTPLVAIDDFRKAADEAKARKAAKPTVDVKAATVSGTFGSKAARKEELDKISRMFEKTYEQIRAMFLALPRDSEGHRVCTEQQREVYYGCHYPHEFTAKRRAAVLESFPKAADIVKELDALVAAREAVKNAP